MPTESGLTFDFSQVTLSMGDGFRFDAYDSAGFTVTWQGDRYTVAAGADNINMVIGVQNTQALLTTTHMQSSRALDYVWAWLEVGNTRPLTFKDGTGRTIMTAPKAIPRQLPNMTFNNAHNGRAMDIHCPNLRGTVGGTN